jgi:hypothetical protein
MGRVIFCQPGACPPNGPATGCDYVAQLQHGRSDMAGWNVLADKIHHDVAPLALNNSF